VSVCDHGMCVDFPSRECGVRGFVVCPSDRPSVRREVGRRLAGLDFWNELENGGGSEVENVSGVVVGQLCFGWG
jgi:hypothetical protein